MRLGNAGRMWEKHPVRVSAFGDVIKVWVWALGSLVIGLWLTPVAFNGGKALFEISLTKDFNGVVDKLAVWSGAARLGDFFMVCWSAVALMLLFPLIEWLRPICHPHVTDEVSPPVRTGRWEPPLRALAGFMATFGCFTLVGYVMVRMGTVGWESHPDAWRKGLLVGIGFALAFASLAEIFYRRVVMGIFLGAMNVPAAIPQAALMFGGVRYLLSGFGAAEKLDGETLSALHLTGIILGGGDLAARVITMFLPWFAFGCVLGWARWRTASPWLPSGLLMGWLLADRVFSKAHHAVASGFFQTGLLQLLGVCAVGGFVHLITRNYAKGDNRTD
jgi:hypothetical protein